MRHRLKCRVFDCQKSKPTTNRTPLLTLTRKSLHSKSTYFYRWGSRKKAGSDSIGRINTLFLGPLRAAWPSLRPSKKVFTQPCKAGFSYVIPSVCSLALLLGGIITLNPDVNGNQAYADEVEPKAADSSISVSFGENASFTENAKVGEVAYIANTLTVNVSKYANYTVKLNAMNGSGTELHGRDNYGATITGVGTNKTPSQFTDNTWGYGWSENTNANPETLTYNSMPAYGSEESMVTKTLTGAEVGLEKSYLLAFAAKIGSNSPADHYVGNFILSVVGLAFTPETFTLNYNANNGTGGPTSQSCTQTEVNGPCTIVITDEKPTRSGYTFLGWSDSSTATEASSQYSAGSTVSLSANKTIYAVWKASDITSLTNMQDMTSAACTATQTGKEVILTDKRDSKKYYVTKLADGNCWIYHTEIA